MSQPLLPLVTAGIQGRDKASRTAAQCPEEFSGTEVTSVLGEPGSEKVKFRSCPQEF